MLHFLIMRYLPHFAFLKRTGIKKVLRQFFLISQWMLVSQAFAGLPFQQFPKMFTLSGGGLINTNAGNEDQHFVLPDNSQHHYSPNHSQANAFVFGGFIGLEFPIIARFNLQTGLAYYQFNDVTIKGNFTQGIDTRSLDKYTYQFKVNSQQILLENKFLWSFNDAINPYLSLGLGVAFNHAKNYEDSAACDNLALTPIYSNHTNNAFTISVGFGADFTITNHFLLGGGYRFVDLGRAELSNGVIGDIPISQTLKNDKLHVQEILIQLSYVII